MYKIFVYSSAGKLLYVEEFPAKEHDQGVQDTIWMALRNPEVGEVTIFNPNVKE